MYGELGGQAGFRRAAGWGTVGGMSELEGEVAPELEVDDADLLEQATSVPIDDDEDYPFGPEGTTRAGAEYDAAEEEEEEP